MRIPPYWAKGTYTGTDREGKEYTIETWGWSFTGVVAAEEVAIARARMKVDRLLAGASGLSLLAYFVSGYHFLFYAGLTVCASVSLLQWRKKRLSSGVNP